MSAAIIREQLLNCIPELQDDENLLSECTNVCQNYNISGEVFFYKVEAIRFNGKDSTRTSQTQSVTSEVVEDIKKGLIADLDKKRLKGQAVPAVRRQTEVLASIMRRGHNTGSKAGKSSSSTPSSSSLSVAYKGPSSDRKKRKYRYMYEKISERSEVLDERIDELSELVRERYNVDELGDPSATTEEDVVVVGRICADADATSILSKLTEGSIFIESSRMQGSGARVPLRFSPTLKLRGTVQGAGAIGLFPGAIAALKGKNGGGGLFVVNEILGLPPLPAPMESSSHKAFSMAIACGPYSHDSDLEYKHFRSLIEKEETRSSGILNNRKLGPFVDAQHSIIKAGETDQLPADIFKEHFNRGLSSFLDASPNSLVLIEPSIRDILSDHPVLPQSEFDNDILTDMRVKMIPNPCRFSINGVSIASTSVDVLMHLKSQEYMQRGQEIDSYSPASAASSSTDMFTNLCRHMLLQRSFYPLFPVPQDLSADVNLDISHSDGLRLSPDLPESAPDVLIFPSKFKQFTKLVDSTWAVNPSFLTKGTYAKISIPAVTRSDLTVRMECEIARL